MATLRSESSVPAPQQGRLLYRLSLLLVLVGTLISVYLSYVQLVNAPMICVEGDLFNCDVVQSSAYAKIFGVPIAYLGLLAYLIIGGLLLLQDRVPLLRSYGVVLQFAVIFFAFIYSMYLVYLQVFVLEALCQWCLAHEIVMTLLFVITIPRLMRSLRT